MKWPWVSRGYFEYVQASSHESEEVLRNEIAWLREELSKALEKRDRIDRVDAGMAEVARPPPVKREPMPQKLIDYIGGFGSKSMKRQMRSTAYRRNAEGESWEKIVEDVVVPEEPRSLYLQAAGYDEDQEEAAGGSEAGAVGADLGSDEPGDAPEGP